MTSTRKYQEVLAATREYAAGIPADAKPVKVTGAYWDIGEAMGVGLRERGTREDELNAERFFGQVRRALDTLSGADRTLVKIGKGDRNLQGYLQTTPLYYTQAQYSRTVTEVQERRAADADSQRRWEDIHDRLSDRGFVVGSKRGEVVRLDLNSWGALLDLLAKANGGW